MRFIIILTVIVYWLLPVDIAPGPLDDIIVTLAGALLAALTPPKDVQNEKSI